MARNLSVLIIIAFGLSMAGCASYGSGSGDIHYVAFEESGEQAAITRYVTQMPNYEDAKDLTGVRIDDVRVAKHDLNDDGVPELILYLEMSSYYCGSGGCDTVILQKTTDGQWREIGGMFGTGLWVSDEKVGGYRTIYSYKGIFLRWKGDSYGQGCTTNLAPEVLLPERPPECS